MQGTLKSWRLALGACCLSVSMMPGSVLGNQPTAPPPPLAEILNRGDAAFDGQRYRESLEAYLEADRLYPDQAKVKVSLATAYAELGNSKDGLEALERAIALEPERLRDAEAIRDLRRRLESLAATDRPPAAGLDPAVLLELKVAAREARLAIEQASKLDDPFKRADGFTRAREILLPILSRLDFESIEAWVTAALIAIDEEDRDWAALAYEAITRLDPEGCLEEPLITVVAQLRALGAAESAASVREARGRLVAAASAPVASEESAIALARAFALGEGVPCNPAVAREWVLRVSPAKHQEVVDSICGALFEQADRRFVSIENQRDPAAQFPVTIENARFRVSSAVLAHAFALSGDLRAAVDTARAGSGRYQESVVARITATLSKAEAARGGREPAEKMLKDYGERLNERTPKLPLDQVIEAQSALAIGWSWLGRHDVAKTWSDVAYTNALKVQGDQKARALAEVAFALAIGGDYAKAKSFSLDAERWAGSLSDGSWEGKRARERAAFVLAYIGETAESLRIERELFGVLQFAPSTIEGLVMRNDEVGIRAVVDEVRTEVEADRARSGLDGVSIGLNFAEGHRAHAAKSMAILDRLDDAIRLTRESSTVSGQAQAWRTIAQVYCLRGDPAHYLAAWSLAERAHSMKMNKDLIRTLNDYVHSGRIGSCAYAHAARVGRSVRGLGSAHMSAADCFGFWWEQ